MGKINIVMKIHELGIDTRKQIVSPQSAGSRGLALNKNRPPKKYYDSVFSKMFSKNTNRQK